MTFSEVSKATCEMVPGINLEVLEETAFNFWPLHCLPRPRTEPMPRGRDAQACTPAPASECPPSSSCSYTAITAPSSGCQNHLCEVSPGKEVMGRRKEMWLAHPRPLQVMTPQTPTHFQAGPYLPLLSWLC
ncbi:hypothetical protein HJG60_011584 [Phyllostomus discolor]|uniref:Uncharacterized protein n=1 Tax=Phyllostomus discolor TaxID=89673 RepID=A0A833ZW27_9CHIR|nr:hypothetical protein HJG60_011584 [Phyllostomus discolor]